MKHKFEKGQKRNCKRKPNQDIRKSLKICQCCVFNEESSLFKNVFYLSVQSGFPYLMPQKLHSFYKQLLCYF